MKNIMENMELIDFIFERVKEVDASLTIIHSMLSEEVKNDFENKITSSVQKLDLITAADLLHEANSYVNQNRERYFQLKGQLISYCAILEKLGIDIPKEYKELLND